MNAAVIVALIVLLGAVVNVGLTYALKVSLISLFALLVLGLAAQPAAADNARTGAQIARELAAGHRVVLKDVVVTGPLDLDGVQTVKSIFECHDCTFAGRVSAHDVVFERAVDLSGSTFKANVNFTGATFQGPALFRAGLTDEDALGRAPRCRFTHPAGFSLAVFDDLVSFARSRFCASADFRDARISDATFSGTWFTTVTAARAAFRGTALFNDAHFFGHASFEETDFRHRADFARAFFEDGGDFAGTRLAEGASFLATRFRVDKADETATFQDAVSSGDLNFTFAEFQDQIATFAGFVSAGSLVFRDATFNDANGVNMDRMQVQDLVLEVDAVKNVGSREQQIDVLNMIEDSAKARDDLTTANDAHYKLRELRSETYNSFWGILDFVFYRGMAGYLVRPLRPLLALVALVAFAALLRMLREPVQPPARDGRAQLGRLWRGTRSRGTTFLTSFLDTLALAGPRPHGSDTKTVPVHSRLEVVGYRLLLICVLVGLANSNPTLRQMVDSLL